MARGVFGDVWKVQDVATNKFYTLKILSKARIIAKKSVKAVI